ncbi:MAG: type IV pilus modification PilV family protein [Minisyncoccia bacterium]
MNKFINKNKTKKSTKGFTLIEVLVAVLLLSITVAALLTLVADSVTAASYGKNDIVATYMGQEALDYFRNVRDTNLHQGATTTTWTDFLRGTNPITSNNEFGDPTGGTDCYSASGCELDIFGLNTTGNPPYVRACLLGCTEIKKAYSSLLGGTTYYTINQTTRGDGTGFKRTINLKQPSGTAFNSGSDVVLVEVTVTWYNGTSLKSKIFTETLYNWKM